MDKETKRRIFYFSGILSALTGVCVLIFMRNGMWPIALALSFFAVTSWLMNKARRYNQQGQSVPPASTKGTTISECKKALIRSWMGGLMLLAALALAIEWGRSEWGLIIVFLALILGMSGSVLLPSYLRCLKNFTEGK